MINLDETNETNNIGSSNAEGNTIHQEIEESNKIVITDKTTEQTKKCDKNDTMEIVSAISVESQGSTKFDGTFDAKMMENNKTSIDKSIDDTTSEANGGIYCYVSERTETETEPTNSKEEKHEIKKNVNKNSDLSATLATCESIALGKSPALDDKKLLQKLLSRVILPP